VLKKLMLLAALLAMLALAVVPALAQVTQENEQDADSGDLNQQNTITGGGDNSTQCANPQITGNTGNAQDQFNALQYASEGGFGGSSANITLDPNEHVQTVFSCTAAVNQAASASG
jgi:hypothetical protein